MQRKRYDWMIPAGLIALSLVPAVAGSARLAQLASGDTGAPEMARFFAAPLPVTIHIVAAIVYSILGAFQFSPGFRRGNGRWHRVAGRILIPAAILVSVTGIWMTLTYPSPPNDGVIVFVERLVFGSAMLWCVILGVDAIRRRRFAEHGAWMIRAYAIGLGAGTQVLTHLPWFVFSDLEPGVTPRAVMMGLGWVLNLVVAEWVIIRHRLTSRRAGLEALSATHAYQKTKFGEGLHPFPPIDPAPSDGYGPLSAAGRET